MCLVLVACVGSLAVPAAADTGLDWIDVLDYATPNSTGSTQIALKSGYNTVTFDLPVSVNLNLVDMLVRHTSNSLSVSVGEYDLTKVVVNETYGYHVRYYGYVGGAQSNKLSLTFYTPNDCVVIFESLKISTLWWADFAEIGSFTFNFNSATSSYTQSSSSSAAGHSFGAETSGLLPFNSAVTCANWKEYDYLRFGFSIRCMEITSITALYGDEAISCDVTQIYDGASDVDTWYVEVTLDLTDIYRGVSGSVPEVYITGTARAATQNFFILSSTTGFIESDIDMEKHFFADYFDSIINSLATIDLSLTDISPLFDYVKTIPTAIGQLLSAQTAALEDSFITMTTSIRGMFTALNGWISDQTTVLSGKIDTLSSSLSGWISAQTSTLSSKLDAIISALDPAADTSSSDSLLDQSEQIHDFESSHQDVLSNGLSTMQGASAISRPHFASALSFIGSVSTSAFQKLDFMQIIYTLPLVIGLIMFLASRAPGRRHDTPKKVDESRPTRHYQNNDAGGYYRWDGHV